MTPTETPETEKELDSGDHFSLLQHAKRMERERDEAREAIRGILKLLDDRTFLRNIDRDSDTMFFVQQGVKIMKYLTAARAALGEGEKK